MSFIKRNIPIATDALTPTKCLLGVRVGHCRIQMIFGHTVFLKLRIR